MNLSDWLDSKNIKRIEFARQIEVSPATITNVCQGRTPRPEIARRIVAATKGKVTLEDLYSPAAAAEPGP